MDVLTFGTCGVSNNEIIKQVTSSWSIFIQLTKKCLYSQVWHPKRLEIPSTPQLSYHTFAPHLLPQTHPSGIMFPEDEAHCAVPNTKNVINVNNNIYIYVGVAPAFLTLIQYRIINFIVTLRQLYYPVSFHYQMQLKFYPHAVKKRKIFALWRNERRISGSIQPTDCD